MPPRTKMSLNRSIASGVRCLLADGAANQKRREVLTSANLLRRIDGKARRLNLQSSGFPVKRKWLGGKGVEESLLLVAFHRQYT